MKDPEKKVLYVYKHHPSGINPLLTKLEAFANGYYKLLTPDIVTTSRAHYNEEDEYVGVSSKVIPGFISLKNEPLKAEDLKDDNIVKRLARCLVSSYLAREDDLHRGNMSKDGSRIDFDSSFWDIVHLIKGGRKFIDGIFRDPKTAFPITAEDILHFPNLVNADPYYFPTLTRTANISDNAFSEEEAAIYSQLENNKVFINEKFKILLKYILTDTSVYHRLASAYFSPTDCINDDNAIDLIVNAESKRIEQMRATLMGMPEFKEFIYSTEGYNAYCEIAREFEDYNQNLVDKICKYRDVDSQKVQGYESMLVDLSKIKENYISAQIQLAQENNKEDKEKNKVENKEEDNKENQIESFSMSTFVS